MEINDNLTPTPGSLEQASSDFVNPATSLSDDGFGTDAFLTLFLEQLQNQDPLNPQDTTEMTAQLATLTQVEQALRSSEALSGVNERLDTLIEATLGKTQSNLDPISMIGRTVDAGLNELSAPFNGESQRMNIEVNAGDFLMIRAADAQGETIGAAVVNNTNADGQPLPLAHGTYQLFFDGSTPKIRLPDGTVGELGFEVIVQEEYGNVIMTGEPARSMEGGKTYDFRALVTGRGETEPYSIELPTTTTGVVDSVRIVDGQSVLTIGNQDIDPTRITGIR